MRILLSGRRAAGPEVVAIPPSVEEAVQVSAREPVALGGLSRIPQPMLVAAYG